MGQPLTPLHSREASHFVDGPHFGYPPIQLMDGWVGSSSRLLWMVCSCEHVCTGSVQTCVCISLGQTLGVELPGHVVSLGLPF